MEKDFRKNCIKRLEEGYVYDREVLNILLSSAFSGQDMTETVDRLLYVFPSANAVLEADFAALMCVPGMTQAVAEYLVVLGKTSAILLEPLKCVHDSNELIGYGIGKFRGRDCEFAELFCVNKGGKVVAFHSYGSEAMGKVELDFRSIAADIVASGAYGFYLLHNHVYGKVQPSVADDMFTAKLLAACPDGVRFLDHCIVGEREGFSYRQSGRLAQMEKKNKK